jgi:hypothetical protein
LNHCSTGIAGRVHEGHHDNDDIMMMMIIIMLMILMTIVMPIMMTIVIMLCSVDFDSGTVKRRVCSVYD